MTRFVAANLPRARRFRSGFTLVEMVLAAGICTLVMAGLCSAMLLAARAADASYRQSAVDMHTTLDRLRVDAMCATAVQKLTSTAVTLTVPDRTGDGVPETIVYDWSQATATVKSLTRTVNGTTELIPLSGVSSFAITSDVVTTTTTTPTESGEQLMFSYSPTLVSAYSIKSNQSTGQFVSPSLPSSATSWRVTRVRFPIRSKGTTGGILRVEVRLHTGGLPTTIVDEATILETSFSTSFATQEVSFTDASGLATSGACIVWHWVKDADAAEVEYETLLGLLSTGQRVISTDGGATWTANTLQAMGLDVYGTYTVPANTTIKTLRALNLTMQADSTLSGTTTTSIRFPNLPQVNG